MSVNQLIIKVLQFLVRETEVVASLELFGLEVRLLLSKGADLVKVSLYIVLRSERKPCAKKFEFRNEEKNWNYDVDKLSKN